MKFFGPVVCALALFAASALGQPRPSWHVLTVPEIIELVKDGLRVGMDLRTALHKLDQWGVEYSVVEHDDEDDDPDDDEYGYAMAIMRDVNQRAAHLFSENVEISITLDKDRRIARVDAHGASIAP